MQIKREFHVARSQSSPYKYIGSALLLDIQRLSIDTADNVVSVEEKVASLADSVERQEFGMSLHVQIWTSGTDIRRKPNDKGHYYDGCVHSIRRKAIVKPSNCSFRELVIGC